ncbi:MAG: YkgJ family cysteine cluster protein [Bacteroidota bacterium]
MKCRKHCGACCIAPSISSAIPGMPEGKPAGVPCVHLTKDFLCALFHSPLRPDVCKNFTAEEAICGKKREEAMNILRNLEQASISK